MSVAAGATNQCDDSAGLASASRFAPGHQVAAQATPQGRTASPAHFHFFSLHLPGRAGTRYKPDERACHKTLEIAHLAELSAKMKMCCVCSSITYLLNIVPQY